MIDLSMTQVYEIIGILSFVLLVGGYLKLKGEQK
jgi:hypothetical protein